MKAQWRSFKLSGLPGVKRPVKATRIPIPDNLKDAFTRQWTPESELNLPTHMMGVQATYDTHVFGLRPNVDVKKVKDSRDHFINANEGYGWTEMNGGRSKLHGPKRGTRPWKVYKDLRNFRANGLRNENIRTHSLIPLSYSFVVLSSGNVSARGSTPLSPQTSSWTTTETPP